MSPLFLAELLDGHGGDAKRGKDPFEKHCGICHKLHGEGEQVGPDLTGYPRHDLAYLLTNVVDPNAVIRCSSE